MAEQNDITKLTGLLEKAQHKAILDAFTKLCKSQFNEDPQTMLDRWFPEHSGCVEPQVSQLLEEKISPFVDNKKLDDQKTCALMVTFSPDPSLQLDFLQLDKLAMKLGKPSKGLQACNYVIEQRGVIEEEAGLGAHFHALLLLNSSEQMGQPARQITRICKMFAKYQTTSTHYLQVKKVSKEKYFSKLEYIRGEKDEPEKQIKVGVDKLWRSQYNAPDYVVVPGYKL